MRELNDIASCGVEIERQMRDAIDLLYKLDRDCREATAKFTALSAAAEIVVSAHEDGDTADLKEAIATLRRTVGKVTQ